MNFGRYTDEDIASYQAMMAESTHENNLDHAITSQHFRKDLQKDVFIARDNAMLQLRLRSKEAWFSLERMNGKTDIVETLRDVSCWLQEDLLYRFSNGLVVTTQDSFWLAIIPAAVAMHAIPQQRLVYLEANKATYDYEEEKFVADDAKIWRYVMEGHALTELVEKQKALISGFAQHVVISFGKQGVIFKAEGFKATLLTPQGGSR